MSNLLCVNAISVKEYTAEPLDDRRTGWDRFVDYAASLPDVQKAILLIGPDFPSSLEIPDYFTVYKKEYWNTSDLFDLLQREKEEQKRIIYVYADCPFLDPKLSVEMLDNHEKYFAEYSYADGYPYGLSPEIISAGILSTLLDLARRNEAPLERDSIFKTIEKDINAFDIETELSPKDFRLLRISLSLESKRNYLICRNLAKQGPKNSSDILRIIDLYPEILRSLPAYVGIQVIDGCPQSCSYCPFPRFGKEIISNRNTMSFADFDSICRQIESFSPETVLGISTWGEASLHPEIVKIIDRVGKSESLSLVVETSGIGWKKEDLKALSEQKYTNVNWIVSLDSDDRDMYRKLRGRGFDEARAAADLFLDLFAGHSYIQAVRMQEAESHLEGFYNRWKEKTENLIIQKYDHFCNFLSDRRVTDISPLKRLPCWHLKRDLYVLSDGTVPLCREDIHKNYELGNLFADTIEKVWENGNSFYMQHTKGDYPELCGSCDEYYTFIF